MPTKLLYKHGKLFLGTSKKKKKNLAYWYVTMLQTTLLWITSTVSSSQTENVDPVHLFFSQFFSQSNMPTVTFIFTVSVQSMQLTTLQFIYSF